jgi:hypothetical protein
MIVVVVGGCQKKKAADSKRDRTHLPQTSSVFRRISHENGVITKARPLR